MRWIDLSHTIRHGEVTYKGLPAPLICDHLSRERARDVYAGAEFQIGKIEMVGNTGTYIDVPFHRYADGHDLAGLPLERVAHLEAIVVNATERPERFIDASYFAPIDCKNRAVLVHTGWSRHWGTDQYFVGHPFLTESAAICLRDRGALLVGIDSLNIDDTTTGARPVHSVLLAENILIVEHLTHLAQLPTTGAVFTAVPPKVAGMGTFPFRAFARINDPPVQEAV
jgi:arylformamidase